MPGTIRNSTVFADGLDHPECVAVHPDGSVWAGGEAGQIYRISSDGRRVETVASTGGFILGVAIEPGGQWLIACDLGKRCLWRVDVRSGKLALFARGAGRHRFSIPNYAAFGPKGELYVSDSGHFRSVDGLICRFEPDGSGRGKVWHPGPFNFANGLAVHPHDSALYVACTWLPGVERVEVRPDGSAGRRSVFVRLPKCLPDGLAFDARANLYVSCYVPARIYRITPRKKLSILAEDWEAHMLANPTNVALAGPDQDSLLVANLGRWHITRITLHNRRRTSTRG